MEQCIIENYNRGFACEQMQDAAEGQIRESQRFQQNAKDEQKNQIKDILLQVFDKAPPPSSFLWNKEKLAKLLTVEERQNGDFYLIFTKRYGRWETDYSQSEEAKCEQEADLFMTCIETVFNVNVNIEKTQKLKPGVNVREKAKAFIRSLNVRDISEAKVDAQALQNYYETFEVLARLKKAIEDWGKENESTPFWRADFEMLDRRRRGARNPACLEVRCLQR